jgi:hypothetical protein
MIRWLINLFRSKPLPAPAERAVVNNWYGRIGRGMPQ